MASTWTLFPGWGQHNFNRMRPIHQLALEHEKRREARMLCTARKLSKPNYGLNIVTEGMFSQMGRSK